MKKEELLQKHESHLIFRNYRPETKKLYNKTIIHFLDFCTETNEKHTDILGYAKAYLTYRFKSGLSWSSVNIDYSAIRILVSEVLQLGWSYSLIPRPRGFTSMPSIMSGRQVESLINANVNLKHKTIVALMYATGLRISEVTHLQMSHIMIDRKQFKVVRGKGGKDRFVIMPDKFIELLKLYIRKYNPNGYLFMGMNKSSRYSISSIRKIVQRGASAISLNISISPHSLRYAYATHHIENGTDLVTLQKQLGHKSINTTIKYINLCRMRYRNICHPIERLNIKLPCRMKSGVS